MQLRAVKADAGGVDRLADGRESAVDVPLQRVVKGDRRRKPTDRLVGDRRAAALVFDQDILDDLNRRP